MPKVNFNRRDFMTHIIKVMAVVTGLSVSEVERLLASGSRGIAGNLDPGLQQRYNIHQKSSDDEIKALKVLIEDNRRIFESQYGRITPIEKKENPKKPGDFLRFCRVEFGGSGSVVDSCDSFYGKGPTCPVFTGCTKNNCNGQNCPRFASCGDNICPGQTCPKHAGCSGINKMILGKSFFEKFESDPYVQHLFERFEATTANQLATQVNDIINRIK